MLRKCFTGLNLTTRRGIFNGLILRNTNSTSDSTIDLHIPKVKRENEPENQRRARLLYQSRKRGMLENDLLLSTFANKYLHTFNAKLLDQYDKLINEPSNDWDLYYWLTGKEEPPAEFTNEVFQLLKYHTQNKEREVRCRQPPLCF